MNAFDVMTGIILAIHLWCVAVATFAPFYAIAAEWREARGDRSYGTMARHLLTLGIIGLLAGTIVGLVYGCFLFDASFSNALTRLSSRVAFGVAEWFISLGLFVLIRLWWQKRQECGKLERALRMFLLFFAATNLAYHFPVLFEVLGNLRRETTESRVAVTSEQFREWLSRPIVASQVIHFLVASVVVGASHLIALTELVKRDIPTEAILQHRRLAGRLIWIAALVQLFVGTWVTINISPASQIAFTKVLSLSGMTFAAAILASLALIPHGLAITARPDLKLFSKSIPIHAGFVVLLMSLLSRYSAS